MTALEFCFHIYLRQSSVLQLHDMLCKQLNTLVLDYNKVYINVRNVKTQKSSNRN